MRAILFAVLICLGLTIAPNLHAADADATFARANAEYAAGKFKSAVDQYESLVSAGQWNPSLFYNLGNAYFRVDDYGRAILNYERALALNPRQPEARANLQLVRDRARALELTPGWMEEHLDYLTRDQYTWLAMIAFWGAVAIATGLYFAKRRPVVWLFAFVLLGTIAAGSAAAVYALETGSAGCDLAVVTANQIQARVATAESAGTVLLLPPGSEVKILSTRGDWDYAALPEDLQGWIPAKSAQRVRL